MIHLINDIYAAEVPEGMEECHVKDKECMMPAIMCRIGPLSWMPLMLPPGNWQLICTTKAVTRMQASEIVEHDDDGWKDYDTNNIPNCYPFTDPLESLRSLLTSKGLDVNKNYVIVKK